MNPYATEGLEQWHCDESTASQVRIGGFAVGQ
jgi:hypothetical protein